MSTVLEAEVLSVVYHNEGSGWVVARVRAKEEPGQVTIVGTLGRLTPGESLVLKGEWKTHPKFGRQLEVASFEQARPATENGVIKYLASAAIKGIGPTTAERMVKRFGVEVLDILDNDPEKLLEIRGISKNKLKGILESWDTQREIKNLIVFLHSHEVPPTFAGRIFKIHGAQSVRRLKENPYELVYEIRGVGFRTADSMALKLGFPADSPQRIQAAVVFCLFSMSERGGHLYVPRTKLLHEAAKLLEVGDVELLEDALGVLEEKKRIHMEDLPGDDQEQAVYLWHFYRYEREIARRLYELLSHPSPVSRKDVEQALPKVETELGFALTDEQREAVLGACTNKAFIITGGPGTGKTTITRAIVATLRRLGLKPKLAAPTGRAAKRLSEATGRSALTLHRMLQFQPDGGFQYGEDKKLKADAMLVDEASMLDAYLCLSVLRALPLTCRLILVGDVNQLPSVGPGNVLADLIRSDVLPMASLSHIFRQAQESAIVTNAHRINDGQFPDESPHPPPRADFFWVRQDDPSQVQRIIVETVCDRMGERYGLNPMRDVQVLTPMHKGEVGTQALNKLLQQRLNPPSLSAKGHQIKRGFQVFRPGDRVLQLRNNYEKEVFNGDLGWIEDVDASAGELSVDFDGNLVYYESSELDDLTLAYAVSVHKSQGSEYPAIVVPVVTQHYIMLQRNLLYTALTRARKLAVMVGGEKAFGIGLRNVDAFKRHTRLNDRLRGLFDQI